MRRKDMGAALHGLANDVQHGNISTSAWIQKMERLLAAGLDEPEMTSVIGAVGSVEPEADPDEQESGGES